VTVLALGVLDVAYSDANGGGAKTTGDVAQILEGRYAVIETFYESRKDKIAEWMAEAISDEIDHIVNGRRPNREPLAGAMEQIEAEFRAFLDANEMAHLVAGFTDYERDYFISKTGGFTGAASRGVNHRLKNPYSSENPARVAFVDTGLYQQSFRAWTVRSE